MGGVRLLCAGRVERSVSDWMSPGVGVAGRILSRDGSSTRISYKYRLLDMYLCGASNH